MSELNRMAESLPEGWSVAYTDDGQIYYQNLALQLSQWTPPEQATVASYDENVKIAQIQSLARGRATRLKVKGLREQYATVEQQLKREAEVTPQQQEENKQAYLAQQEQMQHLASTWTTHQTADGQDYYHNSGISS